MISTTLSSPTSMAFAPDGRLFVTEKGGTILIIKGDEVQSAPFATLTVEGEQSRGLLGLAFDPAFATNGYLYVYYTTPTPAPHNRISRLTASGDAMLADSEVVLFELPDVTNSGHNGGALQVGPDGMLYQLVGDDAVFTNAQSLTTLLGKVLRINRDGSIPPDNPFYETAVGPGRAIYAYGLRNPFTLAFQPGTGRMFLHDVGSSGSRSREEINEGVPGANYGWPNIEGYTDDPRYKSPLYAYGRGSGPSSAAPRSGARLSPRDAAVPSGVRGRLLLRRPLQRMDQLPRSAPRQRGGQLCVRDRGRGPRRHPRSRRRTGRVALLPAVQRSLFRLFYGPGGPSITQHPTSRTVTSGDPVVFEASATGDEPLRYQWQRNSADIPGATARAFSIPAVSRSDNGARFRCKISNAIATAFPGPPPSR